MRSTAMPSSRTDGSVRFWKMARDTDVAAVARSFGGGGHVAAAGFTLSCTLDEARRLVDEALAATFASDEEGACRA